MITGRLLATTTAATLALLLAGCVSERIERRSSRFILPDPESAEASDTGDRGAQFRWLSIGVLEYDDFSIPLLSPDARWIVSRSGAAPGWEEILAEPGSTPIPAAIFTINEIDGSSGLTVHKKIREPWILGRGADERGFLVEEPLEGGARRIGRVGWESGEVTWLVDEGDVAAFASIGPGGDLAYSRRGIDDPAFDLVLRLGDGSGTWVLPSRWERSWIDPVLAPDGRTLFALSRGDGTVELAWTRTTDESRFRDGISTHPISVRTTPRRAHAMLAPQVGAASPSGTRARIIFLHPDLGRLVEWSPETDFARPFPEGTINAAMLDDDSGIATTRDGIQLVQLADGIGRPPTSLKLAEDTAIPRSIEPLKGNSRFLLLRPNAGRYEVMIGEILEESGEDSGSS